VTYRGTCCQGLFRSVDEFGREIFAVCFSSPHSVPNAESLNVGTMIALLILPVLAALIAFGCVHTVHEGHVGVYWRGGALLSEVTSPGFHFKIPVLTAMAEIQVSVQTDAVTQIPCGTSGGVLIHFGKVEVVNRLAQDLVYVLFGTSN